mmetsp:Transcript_14783/g.22924  ORF Transcript_14783/g.22924 Transcript_14783/m.22924 type:complete len:86 (+) Transcript_14783:340-597(+)
MVKSFFFFHPDPLFDENASDADSFHRQKPNAEQINDLHLSSSNESVSSSSWDSSSASPKKEVTEEEKQQIDEAFKGFQTFARRGS